MGVFVSFFKIHTQTTDSSLQIYEHFINLFVHRYVLQNAKIILLQGTKLSYKDFLQPKIFGKFKEVKLANGLFGNFHENKFL